MSVFGPRRSRDRPCTPGRCRRCSHGLLWLPGLSCLCLKDAVHDLYSKFKGLTCPPGMSAPCEAGCPTQA